ncbi:hypothetical protein EG328_004705 [Venturia inaequalis]|uniref:DUF221-domain-containing protein n=1 Tax=Venturia inaequalis TaxID=5025 RepID=A0A8H3YX12_VENIN|nr:hypothetical protein EG328_004705 [Venturia inaequalis]
MDLGRIPFQDDSNPDNPYKRLVGEAKDTYLQIALSVALGLFAFTTFCILRTRWPGLYAARKKQNGAAESLPDLPNTFFGWMPALWRITEEQVLASAGLDAYVFLAFFKMAIKFLAIALVFALVVIKPVHDQFPDKHDKDKDKLANSPRFTIRGAPPQSFINADYLWMYVVFVYCFTFLVMYMITTESRRIIEVRQEYLGSQTTITDRTIRLSGIPNSMRSEEKIKEFIEELDIGKVEKVLLCKNWKKLDQTMVERMTVLRKLEEAWTVHLGHRQVERSLETLPISQPAPPGPSVIHEEEGDRLLEGAPNGLVPYARARPVTRIWHGPLKMRFRYIDAIDYFEEKLRRLDDEIRVLRKKDFEGCELAFVTMDSVAACQMAVQAVLDSSPLQLLANPSPAPRDVVWPNTYMPRSHRMMRAWSITAFIVLLTIFWSVVLVPIAALIDLDRINSVWPSLADFLDSQPLAKSLVQTQLPTLIASLLNVLVPYLYDWLSNKQGMISQGDVELSVISKNFFFLFFNFFIVFTALGTAALAPEDLGSQTPREIALGLANSINDLQGFYTNYIVLQGLGLFPFRLLEFGAVFMYPFSLMGAKTPRDYAEVVQPPLFSYGFFLPQNILIFLICIVYSVLRQSWQVLLPGLAYFVIGYFVHKYQLLYAMDHRQHSTGGSWIMICDRIIVGLVIFQITMAGQLALRSAVKRSVAVVPLIAITVWFSYVYSRSYKPLMKFIALRSIKLAEHEDETLSSSRYLSETRNRPTVDEVWETGMKFVNPSLVVSLENIWIADKAARAESLYSNMASPPATDSTPDKGPMKDDGSAKTATSDSPSTPLPSDIPPRFVSLAMGYPRELIQHIYSYLHPRDFNAARHTCQSWMTASLDKTLLKTMLKRAGWSAKDENYIWGMSCRLARECALSSGWTGNGITDSPLTSPFRQSAWTDFSELASGYGSPTTGRGSCGLVFTVSVCGKFLLVAEGGVIYVYELVGDMLRVLTSVICPRKVLAMSMDASSKRFAVAALLDGRMGLMCDLNVRRASAEESRAAALYPGATVESSTGHRESDRNSLFTTRLYPEDDRLSLPQSSTLPHRRETRNQPSDFLDTPYQASPSDYANARRRNPSDSFETADTENPDPIELTASNPPILLEDTSSLAGRFRNHINQSWNLQLTGFPYSPPIVSPGSKDNNRIKPGIPVETGPRSLYRHLCSNEDPPRSVAICPQRQCVAFGCSSGLELHWVDALTGQDLNRWFPLTGPSDFLYFFPPRHGIDSPRDYVKTFTVGQ